MTLQEMIEEVKQAFPGVPDKQITNMLNRAMDEFCEETEILTDTASLTEQADARYYPLTAGLWAGLENTGEVLKIRQVDYDDEPIKRFIGRPDDTDLTEAS